MMMFIEVEVEVVVVSDCVLTQVGANCLSC